MQFNPLNSIRGGIKLISNFIAKEENDADTKITILDSEEECQKELYFQLLPDTMRHAMVDQTSSACPFHTFVGNEKAVRRLCRAAFSALERENHSCADKSFALIGPASTGKTTIAKLFAELLSLPFVIIQPQSVKTVQDVFDCIEKALAEGYEDAFGRETDLHLVNEGTAQSPSYTIPSCVVFIDEVHNLKPAVVQGLLTATEKKDATMVTESGVVSDMSRVCWMIATTDRGALFDAFDTRFDKIQLRLYSKVEMAQIIKANKPDWEMNLCELVAHYCGSVPREALSFASDIEAELKMSKELPLEEIAHIVAEDHGIDQFGMSLQRLSILEALGQRSISSKQMVNYVQPRCKTEELQNFVMPPLMAVTPDQPEPMVVVSSKGYSITAAGLKELDKRKISHNGLNAIPKSVR